MQHLSYASRRFATVMTLVGLTLSFCATMAYTLPLSACDRGTAIGNGACAGANGTNGGCSACCDAKCITAYGNGTQDQLNCSICCGTACGNH